MAATTALSGPTGFASVRNESSSLVGDKCDLYFNKDVEKKPYYPRLSVNPLDETSVIHAARTVLLRLLRSGETAAGETAAAASAPRPRVVRICGGLTNALLRVDGLLNADDSDVDSNASVLVRIFGSEGLIDRDVDTTLYARLCDHSVNDDGITRSRVVHEKLTYLGRFGNGRVEGWIPNFRPADHLTDFVGAQADGFREEVARQLAGLHADFDPPECLRNLHDDDDNSNDDDNKSRGSPSLWNVISNWLEDLTHSFSHQVFDQKPALLELFREGLTIKHELDWLRSIVDNSHPQTKVSFCHNDLCPGNILIHTEPMDKTRKHESPFDNDTVCIIDYEYGSISYSMYDIANFFNEHCGGNSDGVPNEDLFPSLEKRRSFLTEYIHATEQTNEKNEPSASEEETLSILQRETQMQDLLSQVEVFVMVNHLLWGLWGLVQAAAELTNGTFKDRNKLDETKFDNLRYGNNRLSRYRECKILYQQQMNG